MTASSRPIDPVALLLGGFLGLAILKFGNPVILEAQIEPPTSFVEAWRHAWPLRWSQLGLLIVVVVAVLFGRPKERWREARPPWLPAGLLAGWLAWVWIGAGQTVDGTLTALTLPHLVGCLGCFLAGFLCRQTREWPVGFWIGVLGAFAVCLIKGANQHFFELRQDYDTMLAGQQAGWTNFTPELIGELKRQSLIITTNGIDVANPLILEKMRRARVSGTLVYPNAFAGLILLLLPLSLTLVVRSTGRLRPLTRWSAIALTAGLGLGGLYWSGSKAGWLLALGVAALWLLGLPWARRAKVTVVALLIVGGLAVFGLRFAGYFARGATSASARLDYWKAAVQNTVAKPVFGSGPGTFQRPYAKLKAPESEMARLVHNDYLEQATDSGVPAALLYAGGVLAVLVESWRRTRGDPAWQAVFLGLVGWFAQGLVEFGLYVPALAWTAFAMAGLTFGRPRSTAG
jgi:hypothetical protein